MRGSAPSRGGTRRLWKRLLGKWQTLAVWGDWLFNISNIFCVSYAASELEYKYESYPRSTVSKRYKGWLYREQCGVSTHTVKRWAAFNSSFCTYLSSPVLSSTQWHGGRWVSRPCSWPRPSSTRLQAQWSSLWILRRTSTSLRWTHVYRSAWGRVDVTVGFRLSLFSLGKTLNEHETLLHVREV